MPQRCDFCGGGSSQVGPLIEGKAIKVGKSSYRVTGICTKCVQQCHEIVGEFSKANKKWTLGSIPRPHAIFHSLGEFVVGQEDTKRVLAVAVANHYKRIMAGNNPNEPFPHVKIQKS